MSSKESKRIYVMQQVLERRLTVAQAALTLDLTERQVYRLKGGMKMKGIAALAHQNRGRKPSHAVSLEVRKAVIRLATTEYQGASYQHMSELLAHHQDITLSWKTIGRLLTQAGVVNPHAHRPPRRRRSRQRMPCEGMLIQCDASPHPWLEDRGPKMSLHGGIDDATGKIVGLYFRPEEDLIGYFHVLEQTVVNFGVPDGWYSDRHTIFVSPKTDKLSVAEELAGVTVALTQFGKALHDLGIRHVKARSPQAKGRVERLWGTLQHRLIIELRLATINTLEDANCFLPEFIVRFNRRFSIAAREKRTAFRTRPSKTVLERILCQRFERSVDHGSSLSFQGQTYQLVNREKKVMKLRPHDTVSVLLHRNGRVSALYENQPYALEPFHRPQRTSTQRALPLARVPIKPAVNHPWKLAMKLALAKKEVTFSQSG